jgi:sugar/nucleoside kinase (ribokinase family)
MITDKITISGTGCALADFLYNGISFDSPAFRKYLSQKPGDGGLSPGKLVFTGELEKFAGRPYPEIVNEIIGSRAPDAFNVGGPSIVALIHAAQLLGTDDYEVRFYGLSGQDETAAKIKRIAGQTPLNLVNYSDTDRHATPFTDVLSDPDYDNGHGDRTFINNIGAAGDFFPDDLPPGFFNSKIVAFGGTALVPRIHDSLTVLLEKARNSGSITVVNTVFDFRNEKTNPGKPWPLVRDNGSYGLIDLLIMDYDEALRISGKKTLEMATDFFTSTGVKSFIITNGARDLTGWSQGGLFIRSGIFSMPVSRVVTDEIRSDASRKGDTTGCGDNFAGGVIASLAWQYRYREPGQFDFTEAISWGVASGGFCCFSIGGTYLEHSPGEKKQAVQHLQQEYMRQIGY